jgi:hypothetical protein
MATTGVRHTLIGAADRCCPALCDYRPEAVQVYLNYVLDMERHGEDPVEVSACKPINRDGRGGAAGNGATQVWDVRRAVEALRSERREVNAANVARKLCPWSLDP